MLLNWLHVRLRTIIATHDPIVSGKLLICMYVCIAVWCVAVCCSVLQCVAVCCSVLQCVAVCCSVLCYTWDPGPSLLHTTRLSPVGSWYVCMYVLQCGVLQCDAVGESVLQCVAVCCSVLCCTWDSGPSFLHTTRLSPVDSWFVCIYVCGYIICITCRSIYVFVYLCMYDTYIRMGWLRSVGSIKL